MRHVYAERPGPHGRFVVVDGDTPVAKAGEVLVEVEAAGLAFADVLMCAGAYPGTPRAGFNPGYDLVGRIAAVDIATTGWSVGDRVAALLVRGGLAEQVRVDARRLVRVPSGVDAVQAACLPLNYVTAWQLLHRVAKVQSDAKVLVFGAGGGVGSALCQLAALHGCTVLGAASGSKHTQVAKLGAVPVTSRTASFPSEVRALAGGRGVDACFDAVGGAQLALGWSLLAPGGHLVSYGFAGSMFGAGPAAQVFLSSQLRMAWWRLTGGSRRISFYAVADRMSQYPEEYAKDLVGLFDLLATGGVTPVIDSVIPLDSVPEAYQRLRAGAAEGKIVVSTTHRQ